MQQVVFLYVKWTPITAEYKGKIRRVMERKSLNALASLFLTFSCYVTIRKVLKRIIRTS